MKKLLFLSIILLDSFFVYAQLDEDMEKIYKEEIVIATGNIGKTIENIAKFRNNPEFIEFARKTLKGYFFERGVIYHQFRGYTQTQGYSIDAFVDSLIRQPYQEVRIFWTPNYNSVTFGPLVSDPNDTRLKIYDPCVITLGERFIGERPNEEFVFDKQLDFRLYEFEDKGDWKIITKAVKSSICKNCGDRDNLEEPISKNNGKPTGNCPQGDRDNDGICDEFDPCPDDPTNSCERCPSRYCGISWLLPSLGDYRCGKEGEPHWLWSAGVVASAGLGTHFLIRSNRLYPGNVNNAPDMTIDFQDFRKAKLADQNAKVFFGLAALIWLTDSVQGAITCGKKRRDLGCNCRRGQKGVTLNPYLEMDSYYVGGEPNMLGTGTANLGLRLKF